MTPDDILSRIALALRYGFLVKQSQVSGWCVIGALRQSRGYLLFEVALIVYLEMSSVY